MDDEKKAKELTFAIISTKIGIPQEYLEGYFMFN